MGDGWNTPELGKLAKLAERGVLYQASDAATATALVAANFVFWSGSSKGLPVRLISVRVTSAINGSVTFGTVINDPALALGNPPVNLRLGGASAQAYNEAAAVAATPIAGILGSLQFVQGIPLELLAPAGIYLPPNSGVAIVSAVAAADFEVTWLWAEIPRE